MKSFKAWLLAGLATVAIILLLLGAGILLECEYPYYFLLRRVAHAHSCDGVSVQQILDESVSETGGRIHWHTDSYLGELFGVDSYIVLVTLELPVHAKTYHFAYNTRT